MTEFAMIVDKVKTAEYYETLSEASFCDCDYCRLYRKKAGDAFPELANWLIQYGVDISKPFETMWLDPDENGVVHYLGVQYLLFGFCAEDEEYSIGNITIRPTSSHPTLTDIEGDFFVLEAYPLCLTTQR